MTFRDYAIKNQILYSIESLEIDGKILKDRGKACNETIVITKSELKELTKEKHISRELIDFFSGKKLIVTE